FWPDIRSRGRRAMPSTSPTLLGRLQGVADPLAWQAFERRYGPRILAWCRDKGLQQADAENVSQEVLLRVARLMRTFVYKPGDNFSGVLRTIWGNAGIDFVRREARSPGGRGVGQAACPPELVAVADDELTRALEREIEREELHEALSRVQPIVSPR